MRAAVCRGFFPLVLILALGLVVDAQYFDRQLSPQSRNFISSRTQEQRNRRDTYNTEEADVALARLFGVTDDEEKNYVYLRQNYQPSNVNQRPQLSQSVGLAEGNDKRQASGTPCGTGIGTTVNVSTSLCPANNCQLTSVYCNGAAVAVDGTEQNVNFTQCTIAQVRCGTTPISWNQTDSCVAVLFNCSGEIVTSAAMANTTCRPLRLFCGGTTVVNLLAPPASAVPLTPQCPRDELRCGVVTLSSQQDMDAFRLLGGDTNTCTLDFQRSTACDATASCGAFVNVCNDTDCTYVFSSTCSDPCLKPASTSTVCRCPLDKTGKKCEVSRPVLCEWKLISPQPKCEPVGKDADLLDIDPVCFVYPMTASIDWRYTLSCAFQDQTPAGFVDDAAFTYFARVNDSFALSKAPDAADPIYEAIMKVFNFNILSDKNGSQIVRLSAAQLEGRANVVFNLSLPTIPAKYFAGGRLYFEVSIFTERHAFPGLQKRYDRRFVDPVGAPRRFASGSGVSFWNVFWIIVLILLAIGAVVGLFMYLRRRRAKRLKRLRKEKEG